MAMGVLFATGTARSGVDAGPETREAELERVPTYVLGGAVVMRTLRGAGRRLGSLRGGRHGRRDRPSGRETPRRGATGAPRPTAAATRMVGRSDGWRDPREMELTSSPERAKEPSLLVPEGSFLVHIGPHKTGTTSLQAALWRGRPAMLEQGVRHIGPSRNPSNAVRSVTGQSSPYADDTPPPIRHWRSLVKEVNAAHDPRLVISSEFFAWAKPDVIRRVVEDLGGDRVHIAVTLRSLGRVMPSMWQQNIQSGAVGELDSWLRGLLERPPDKPRAPFWTLHRHDELIARWAEVVGPDRVTAIVVDDRDHQFVLRTFERLLGLRDGTLEAHRDLANRSLTLPEVEAVRAFNVAFKAEQLDRALHARVMRFGAAQQMKAREPSPDEPRVEMPSWALDHVDGIARSMVDAIAASGVRVVGDIELLTERVPSRADDAPIGVVPVPPVVAAAMTMGVLVSTGATREASKVLGGYQVAEPVELVRIPTYQVMGVIAIRARRRDLRPPPRAPPTPPPERRRRAEAALTGLSRRARRPASRRAPRGSGARPPARRRRWCRSRRRRRRAARRATRSR